MANEFPLSVAIPSLSHLLSLAVGLGAKTVSGWSNSETRLTRKLVSPSQKLVDWAAEEIRLGGDPLGDAFCALKSADERRGLGATYTPRKIVSAMMDWCADNGKPSRIIDPGVGSGRFLISAARRFPNATGIGVDVDPVAAIMARGSIAAAGLQDRLRIVLGDFRECAPKLVDHGQTLFVGNPPYVRHHLLSPTWKNWLSRNATKLGLSSSQLAGLHVYFMLATALVGRKGDYGCFVTAAEWLDVNYGSLVRELFLGRLGGERLVVVEPTAAPFPDAATTAAITCFKPFSKPKKIGVQRITTIEELGRLKGGNVLRRERLEGEHRWSQLTRRARKLPAGHVELGELFRVHRGQVTGANHIWIAGEHSRGLPASVQYSAVTRAKELFSAGLVLEDATTLKKIIDLPYDLDSLSANDKKLVLDFLKTARHLGADRGYVANQRRSWWAVGLKAPAPILATYMARRPPAFVVNQAEARHINIAHGLYPREPLSASILAEVARYLSSETSLESGRTYAGGLTKFEPREMERLAIPGPELLTAHHA